MSTPKRIIVVGGGLAGAKAVEALRERGYDGALALIGSERLLPYERPPLSKGYLAGDSEFDEATVLPRQWYSDHDVDLRLATTVSGVDADGHQLTLDGGDPMRFDKLLLATGSTPRRLGMPGADAEGVLYLRTRADSDAIRAQFGSGRRLVIIGAGWIGLEVAAAARNAGTEVTVLEVAELPLLAVLGREIAQVFAELHREHGVDLRLGVRLSEILVRDGRAVGVRLEDGSTVAADAVVVGVGAQPDIRLAADAGLQVDNGVLVDGSLRSSHPDVFAVGDIANHDHPVLGTRVRVEHWATALNQPGTVAGAMLGGDDSYTELPYFFSDQYDLGMEYIGYAPGGSYDRVLVRGDLPGREFVAFWLAADNTVKAAMNVNVWDVVDEVKPLIAEGRVVDPQRLTDPDVPYTQL